MHVKDGLPSGPGLMSFSIFESKTFQDAFVFYGHFSLFLAFILDIIDFTSQSLFLFKTRLEQIFLISECFFLFSITLFPGSIFVL